MDGRAREYWKVDAKVLDPKSRDCRLFTDAKGDAPPHVHEHSATSGHLDIATPTLQKLPIVPIGLSHARLGSREQHERGG